MDRLLIATAPTIEGLFTVDGVATDAVSVTVTITRDDGSTILTAAPATRAATGLYTYQLTSAQLADLDILTAAWTGTINGQPATIKTVIEIVGGFLFTTGQARARSPFSDAVAYPAVKLAELRTIAEEDLEQACRIAFVPRYARHRTYITRPIIRLPHQHIRRVRWGTIDGVAISAAQIAALRINESLIMAGGGWRPGAQVTLGYEHGLDYPPALATQAALDLLEIEPSSAVNGIDPRAERVITDDGTIVLANGDTFALPSVDRLVKRYAAPLVA